MNLITKIACLALLIGGSTLSAQPVDTRSGEPAPQGGPTGEVTKTPNYPVRGTAQIPGQGQQGQQYTNQPRGQAQPCTAQPRGQVSAQPAQRPVGTQVQGQRCDQNQNNVNQNNNNVNQNNNSKAQNNNVKLAPAAMNNGMTQGQTNSAPANNNGVNNGTGVNSGIGQDKTAPASKDAMSK
jgi:hypothetical protein